jgi:hypothetical protein
MFLIARTASTSTDLLVESETVERTEILVGQANEMPNINAENADGSTRILNI